MKILIDMNLSPGWAATLTGAGFPATHWSVLGRSNATDAEIMAFAATNEYVVLTHDLDFSGILAASRDHKPSVVQLRADNLSPGAIGPVVVAALRQMQSELATGALITIEPHRTRVTVLPLPTREP